AFIDSRCFLYPYARVHFSDVAKFNAVRHNFPVPGSGKFRVVCFVEPNTHSGFGGKYTPTIARENSIIPEEISFFFLPDLVTIHTVLKKKSEVRVKFKIVFRVVKLVLNMITMLQLCLQL